MGYITGKYKAVQRARYKNLRNAGLCICGKRAVEKRSRCQNCLKSQRTAAKKSVQKCRDAKVCIFCRKGSADTGHVSCKACRDGMKSRIHLEKLSVLDAYGGRLCGCCGISIIDFLCIDHIDGGGSKHIRSLKMNFYAWLIKNKFPAGFQVLCWNCNHGKRMHGKCPYHGSTSMPVV